LPEFCSSFGNSFLEIFRTVGIGSFIFHK
jgi:hypothetical protein